MFCTIEHDVFYLRDGRNKFVVCQDVDRMGWFINDRSVPPLEMQECIRSLGSGLNRVIASEYRIQLSHVTARYVTLAGDITYVTIELRGPLDKDVLFLHIANFTLPLDKCPYVGHFAYGLEGDEACTFEGRI